MQRSWKNSGDVNFAKEIIDLGLFLSFTGIITFNNSTLADVINKIDLADKVGADLNIMKSDTEFMRKGKPWFFTNLSSGIGVEEITQFLESHIPNNRNLKNVH